VADAVVTLEERSRVRAALARLPHKQAVALVLRHSGLSYADVAAALDLSPGSVGTTVRRAESTLRKELTVMRHPTEGVLRRLLDEPAGGGRPRPPARRGLPAVPRRPGGHARGRRARRRALAPVGVAEVDVAAAWQRLVSAAPAGAGQRAAAPPRPRRSPAFLRRPTARRSPSPRADRHRRRRRRRLAADLPDGADRARSR
jgi:DNA-binding CsgD family transcriptional regulator